MGQVLVGCVIDNPAHWNQPTKQWYAEKQAEQWQAFVDQHLDEIERLTGAYAVRTTKPAEWAAIIAESELSSKQLLAISRFLAHGAIDPDHLDRTVRPKAAKARNDR